MTSTSADKAEKSKADGVMIKALSRVKGIVEAQPLLDHDRQRILDIEEDAEKRALMGLGKVVNTGVKDVMSCDLIYAVLSNMDFDWGCHPVLVLKKGAEIVGEEVRDEKRIAALATQENAWFMHSNFVVYKDRISFPQDMINQICQFEIPSLPCDWLTLDREEFPYRTTLFCNPATTTDMYLKERYFHGRDERGLGTILIGVRF